jgi:hypothetical protein
MVAIAYSNLTFLPDDVATTHAIADTSETDQAQAFADTHPRQYASSTTFHRRQLDPTPAA